MQFQKLLKDMAVISKLGHNPGTDNGLSADGLKAKFDEAPLAIQAYINSVLVDGLNALFALEGAPTQEGGNFIGPINMGGNAVSGLPVPTNATDAASKQYVDDAIKDLVLTLPVSGWENGVQSISCTGMTASAPVIVSPDPDSWEAYTWTGVRCTAQSDGTLTFACNYLPEADLTVNVLFFRNGTVSSGGEAGGGETGETGGETGSGGGTQEAQVYQGSYTVTPSTEAQVLATAGTYMEQDITVSGIPYENQDNDSGGLTVSIANS